MINISKYSNFEFNPDVSVRKVLIEKYSVENIIKWVVLQKYRCVQNLDFEKAANWRGIENSFINPSFHSKIENRVLKITYFQLFEIIK